MLTDIHIKDFITIHELQLRFPRNTTVFTGETGSGKSIFIEAIELVLGGRASSDTVRHGKERADISLSFDISNYPYVKERLQLLELHTEQNDCFLRRTITRDGKSKCYVNSIPVTLQLMRELGDELFHLHSQHEQQILFKPDTQRRMLDQYADAVETAQCVQKLRDEWQQHNDLIDALTKDIAVREQKSLFLQHQLDELKQLNIQEKEWQQLEQTHQQLATQAQSLTELHQLLALFQRDDAPNAFSILQEIRKKTEHAKIPPTTSSSWLQRIESVISELRDIESDIQRVIDCSEKNPDTLEQVETRMGELFSLSRKYKVQPGDLYAFYLSLQQEFQALQHSDERLEKLHLAQEKTLKAYQQHAKKLSEQRQREAKKLSKQVNHTIHQLALPHAEFMIECHPDDTMISSHGFDKIQFLMRTQPDAPHYPIAKALSGGELSRLSLALHLALANQTSIPTLIFDEVDTGIGGATAEKIGKLLRILGQSHQVFTITHQAQVAVQAMNHVYVEKIYDAEGTRTELRFLDKQERINEIARMLGGETITETTRSHAEEILNTVLLL